MSGPVEIWKQTADSFGQRLSAVTDEHWSAKTPCEEWDVRALVDHTLGVQTMIIGALGGSVEEGADWNGIRSGMEQALESADALEGNLPEGSPLGPMPKHQVLGIGIGDMLIHTWDLSRSIDHDDTLPPAAVQASTMGLKNMPAEFMRAPGRFGNEVAVGDEASAQDQLIAFTGRQP